MLTYGQVDWASVVMDLLLFSENFTKKTKQLSLFIFENNLFKNKQT